MDKGKIRAADFIADFIAKEIGVKHVFMLSGGGMMHLTDGLAKNKYLKKICFHHEQGAAMALEAYARTNNHFGVGFFTTGPGATNAITGTAGAWLDSSPCLYISGQAKRREATYQLKIKGLRQCGVQELNIMPIVESITKFAAFVDDPQKIKFYLQKAYYIAKSGRPGPVWLDIPMDVQASYVEPDKLKAFVPPNTPKPTASQFKLKKLVELFKKAKRPVIIAGYGVRISNAIPAFHKLVDKYHIPVVTTFLGIDVIANSHPMFIGRMGIKGTRAGNLAIQNSDLLLVIGSSLPVAEIGFDYKSFARRASIVVVDIEPCSHKKKAVKIDLFLKSDAKEFIQALSTLLGKQKFSTVVKWFQMCQKWKNKYPACLPQYAKRKNKINIYYLVDKLSRKLVKGDVVVTDAGSVFYAGSQAVYIKKGVRYITSGGFATMGFSLPASIGVNLANGGKRVICITGDGSFQQNIQELQTVIHHRLPIKIFVLNNEGYLSIRYTQKRFFNRLLGEGPKSGVSFPDTEKIAGAYGIKFVRASKNKQLNVVLNKVLNFDGPIICEVMTPKNQLIIPTVSSKKMSDGTMVSQPLENMYPFLPRKEYLANIIK